MNARLCVFVKSCRAHYVNRVGIMFSKSYELLLIIIRIEIIIILLLLPYLFFLVVIDLSIEKKCKEAY